MGIMKLISERFTQINEEMKRNTCRHLKPKKNTIDILSWNLNY